MPCGDLPIELPFGHLYNGLKITDLLISGMRHCSHLHLCIRGEGDRMRFNFLGGLNARWLVGEVEVHRIFNAGDTGTVNHLSKR